MAIRYTFIAVVWAAVLYPGSSVQAQSEIDHEAEYARCLELVRQAPAEAAAASLAWEQAGGGNGARHCAALAQFELGAYWDAAQRLTDLGRELAATDPALAAELLLQAGEAWMLAEAPWRGEEVLTEAIALRPSDADLLVARAYARAGVDDDAGALADLDRAAALAPGSAQIGLLRGAALRRLGRYGEAEAVLTAVLTAGPEDPAVLLERGNARRLAGDPDGARADWRRVLELVPSGPVADAAATNLERLEP